MIIEIGGHATSRAVAIAFLQKHGFIKGVDKSTGEILTSPGVNIYPQRVGEELGVEEETGKRIKDALGFESPEKVKKAGWHFDLRLHGEMVEKLSKVVETERTRDEAPPTVWERTKLKEELDKKSVAKPVWADTSVTKTPPGYQDASGVRLFDLSLVKQRRHGFA